MAWKCKSAAAHLDNCMVVPQKKIEYPILSWNSTYRYILEGIGSTDSDICVPMFLELLTNSQKLETLECQSIGYKYSYTHTHTHTYTSYTMENYEIM